MWGEPYIGRGVSQDLLDKVKSELFDIDETLLCAVSGLLSINAKSFLGSLARARSGILLMTSKRMLFYHKKMVGKTKHMEFDYEQISNLGIIKRYIIDKLVFDYRSEKVLLDSVKKSESKIVVQTISDMIARASRLRAQAQTAVSTSNINIMDQIEKLGELMEKGLITKEEYERKKSELLDRL